MCARALFGVYFTRACRIYSCMREDEMRMRKRQAAAVCVIGTVFAWTVGSLSHFFYAWSGNDPIAAVFFPVNESVWEHMKLAFFPFFAYFLILLPFCGRLKDRVFGAFCATAVAAAFIPAVYYGYTAFTGRSVLAADITIYAVACASGMAVAYVVFTCGKGSRAAFAAGAAGSVFIAACWLTLTYFAPEFFLFVDPRTRHVGI